MPAAVAVGIDLGGTNLKAAAVDRAGRIHAQRTARSEVARGPSAVVADMTALVLALVEDLDGGLGALLGVGVGCPGPLSVRAGRVIHATNLPGWKDVPLRDLLAERLGPVTGRHDMPIAFENDGNAAAYGEFWVGAGRRVDDLVMLTLGTGVGAGIIIDGEVLHGVFENAAELGHTIVVPDGLPCPCGQRGCLEQYASAAAVARRVAQLLDGRLDGRVAQADAPGPSPNCTVAADPTPGLSAPGNVVRERVSSGVPIDAAQVARAAQAGDPLCAGIWDEACRYLAVACVNIQHSLNPALVVLGGGMSQAGPFLIDRVRHHFEHERWSLHDDFPEIVLAELGSDAGVIGAAGLAWQMRHSEAGMRNGEG